MAHSPRLALALLLLVALSAAGCASQHGGVYTENGSSSLGGPGMVRVADAVPQSTQATSGATQYVYRGGRDPITGRAAIQEGRAVSR